jgi:Common central domain of tyrosinase
VTEGDGIRRNVAHIDLTEKKHLRDAIIQLHKDHYLGERGDPIPGGVSKWFKQDEIHQGTHVHDGPAFLTWHRELCNRFEDLLREVNRNLSLHYWDWTTNPYPLFTPDFMGNPNGSIGEPWKAAGFYNPDAANFRGDAFDLDHNNPFDPPKDVTRYVDPRGGGPVSKFEDALVLAARDYTEMRVTLEDLHNRVHGFFNKVTEDGVVTRSTLGNGHTAFRDPFVFLLHSNVDRLFAMWQYRDPLTRLSPNEVYGAIDSASTAFDKDGKLTSTVGILTPLEPWAGIHAPGAEADVKPVRPWAPPENKLELKTSKHISVVIPRPYDTALFTKAITKELDIPAKILTEEAKVPDRKEIPDGKVPEKMPMDVGLFAERLGRIEERLATMESFIRPNERPQLGQKERRHIENNDERQNEE